jgi:hypothetical protein
MSSRRDENGFILFWLMAFIAVTLVGVTVIAATDVSQRDRQRIDQAEGSLIEFDSAIVRFKREAVGKYSSRLWQLSQHPVNSDLDICGNAFSNSNPGSPVTGWQGPYVTRFIEKHVGTPIGIGSASDTLVRYVARTVSTTGGGTGGGNGGGGGKPVKSLATMSEASLATAPTSTDYYGIYVSIPLVVVRDAEKLDERFDAAYLTEPRPDTTGQVKWDQPTGSNSTTTVRYYTAVAKVDTLFTCP